MIECSASDYVRMNVIVKLDRDNDSVIMIVMFFSHVGAWSQYLSTNHDVIRF